MKMVRLVLGLAGICCLIILQPLPVVVMTPILDGISDICSNTYSLQSTSACVTTLMIRALYLGGAYGALRAAFCDLKRPARLTEEVKF